MARKSSKTRQRTGEVAAEGARPGQERPAGQPLQAQPGEPGGLTMEELGGLTAGATRIRIKVDFADLNAPDDAE
jgi:hypothetical protein